MITLLTTYYPEPNIKRNQELVDTITNNFNGGFFDKLVLIVEGEATEPPASVAWADIHHQPTRPTFADLFKFCNDGANVIANTDIIFDASIRLAEKIGEDEAWCLSRWWSPRNIEPISNDVWVFRGPCRVPAEKATYWMGRPKCDNRLTYELQRTYKKVINPAISVKCLHNHASEVRNYSWTDPAHRVPGRNAGIVSICSLPA